MERASVADACDEAGTSGARADLGDALGATDVAVVRYRLAPGEGLPSGLHAHYDQEELFVVLAGEVAFEHLPPVESWAGEGPEGREVTVVASEAVRFAPGEFQTGRNPESTVEDAVVLALGAPRDTEDVRIPAACPDCGAPTLRLGSGHEQFTFDCADCESSFEPAPCPDCGSHDLGMHLDDGGRPVSTCADCGSEYESPPLAE